MASGMVSGGEKGGGRPKTPLEPGGVKVDLLRNKFTSMAARGMVSPKKGNKEI